LFAGPQSRHFRTTGGSTESRAIQTRNPQRKLTSKFHCGSLFIDGFKGSNESCQELGGLATLLVYGLRTLEGLVKLNKVIIIFIKTSLLSKYMSILI